ncbi:MAG: hypothetical protein MAG795_00980 [Candidatus Woesearchaeota archaeon]|nr:hypothetical protein [Candidatus Woesearchaeota archaeon]
MGNKNEKDRFYAIVAFVLSLCFFIPLINFPLTIVSICFGITALKLAHKDQDRYGGRKLAVIAIILSSISLLLGVITGIYYFIYKL